MIIHHYSLWSMNVGKDQRSRLNGGCDQSHHPCIFQSPSCRLQFLWRLQKFLYSFRGGGVLLALTWLVSASWLVFYAERDQCGILLETVVSVFKAISSGAEEIAAWTRAIPLWTFSPITPWSLWLLWTPVLTISHTLLKLVSAQNQSTLKGLVISLVLPLRHTGHILRFLWENTGSQGDSS